MAVLVHSAFNHFVLPPVYQTLLVLIGLPPLMLWVFARSERALEGWIGTGFDHDRELIELLDSGTSSQSPTGQYLHGLRERFPGPVIADMVCYLRLCVELALRAKGILMMRESGFDATVDESTRDKFAEMRYLQRSIGATGRLAAMPLLHGSDKDIWQLNMLESESSVSVGKLSSKPTN